MSSPEPLPAAAKDRLGLPLWSWVALVTLVVISASLRFWAAAPNPGPKRFWDERYLVANTARVLTDGWNQRQNVYYPGLGHAPTAIALRIGSDLGLVDFDRAVLSRRHLGAVGYRVARATSVLWGVVGIVFLVLAGGRLDGRRMAQLGLLAATIMAFAPWHLRQSIIYKPDIALCALVGGSLWACLRLDQRSTSGNWVLFFVLPALAFSAKWNAAPLLVPMAWVVVRRLRSGESLGRKSFWLGPLAGVVLGTTLLVALNPTVLTDPAGLRSDLSKTARHYEGRAEKAQAAHWQMPAHAVSSISSDTYLGPVIGAFGWVGLFVLCWGRGAAGWRLLASWVLVYVGVYSVATAYPSPHNWLPLLPALCLSAGGAILRLWRWRRDRLSRIVISTVILLALGERVVTTLELTHREAVPTTAEVAEQRLAGGLGTDFEGRIVVSEVALQNRLRGFATQGRTLNPRLPRLLVVTPARVPAGTLADGAVWRPEGAVCSAQRASALLGVQVEDSAVQRVPSGVFRGRGEPLCVAVSVWRRMDGGQGASEDDQIARSLDLVHPASWSQPATVSWRVPGADDQDQVDVPCLVYRPRRDRMFCRTPRVLTPGSAEPVVAAGARRATVSEWQR